MGTEEQQINSRGKPVMGDEAKVKILLLGPISSGKTTVANFLSNSGENLAGEYRPTKGVRIVEFVTHGVRGKGIFQSSAEVELWDCSGDNRYQSCWPAIQHKADGIVFVYSEATSPSQNADLEMLKGFFVEEVNFPESCCLVVRNEFGEGKKEREKSAGNPLPNLSHVNVNLEERGPEFRKNFASFLSDVMKAGSNS